MTLRNMARMLAILSALSPAAAFSADWVVTKVSQPSRYSVDGKTWQPVTKGLSIPNKSWISTGPRGRVVLERAKDQVTFQPGTMAGVFEKKGFAIHTDFAQQSGTLELSIDPKVKPHLAVQTPYLAAVVKGTVFTVSVGKKNSSVSVDRGRVEVTDTLSGERTGVAAGQKASVDNNPSTSMSLSGKNRNFEPVTHVAVPSVTSTYSAPTSQPTDTTADDGKNNSSSSQGQSSTGSSSRSGSSGNSGAGNDSGHGSGKGGSSNGNGSSDHGNSGKGGSGPGIGGHQGPGGGPGKGNDSGPGKGNDGPGKGGKPGEHSEPNGKPGKDDPGPDKPGKPGKDHPDKPGKPGDDHPGNDDKGKGGGSDRGNGEGKGGKGKNDSRWGGSR